jgi:N-acetylmuramoyl-L-alanine amidase
MFATPTIVVLLIIASWQQPALATTRIHQKPTESRALLRAEPSRFLVVIDPGHGGKDTGAIYRHGKVRHTEKDLTLAYGRSLAAELRALGVPVILTRNGDDKISLDLRAAVANRSRASLFVSIHFNASNNGADHGVETYVLNTTSNKSAARLAEIENGRGAQVSTLSLILADLETTANYQNSLAAACLIQSHITSQHNRHFKAPADRHVRGALFYVLMQTHMPSVLVELGYPTNAAEWRRLASATYRRIVAKRLAQAVLLYRDLSHPSPAGSGLAATGTNSGAKTGDGDPAGGNGSADTSTNPSQDHDSSALRSTVLSAVQKLQNHPCKPSNL